MEGGQTNEFRPLILVAEDDDSNFKLIKAIIGKKCDIQWAKNGEEIVALFKEYGHEAQAILMDWMLRKSSAEKTRKSLLSCRPPTLSALTRRMR